MQKQNLLFFLLSFKQFLKLRVAYFSWEHWQALFKIILQNELSSPPPPPRNQVEEDKY